LASSPLVLETSLDGLTRHNQGKVRDIYSFAEDPTSLLIVATDRISAFDYVLGSGVPDKGKVLTQLSAFWFGDQRHRFESYALDSRRRLRPRARC
jgi:phosphoribosylaminoimidazole-succinocarboxamide synthase